LALFSRSFLPLAHFVCSPVPHPFSFLPFLAFWQVSPLTHTRLSSRAPLHRPATQITASLTRRPAACALPFGPSRYIFLPSSLLLLAFHSEPPVSHGTPLTPLAHLRTTAMSRPIRSGRPSALTLTRTAWTFDPTRPSPLGLPRAGSTLSFTQPGSGCPRPTSRWRFALTQTAQPP
jgi:hypothetical protein